MKESMNTQCPPTPPTPQQAPQHYLQPPPPVILQNPIPHQGVMNTQQEIKSNPPQMGQYQNLGPNQPENLADRNILHTSEEEIILQTHNHPYDIDLLNLPQPPQKKLSLPLDNH
jgi:hypothetical protein